MTEAASLRVLLVDDDSALRMMFSALLQAAGMIVEAEAEDGRQALDLFKSLHPDVVLMDLNMPEMDGLEALKAIRQESADARVIMLSGLRDEDVLQSCVEAGAVGYIRKDKPVTNLANTVRRLYEDSRN